MVCSRDDIRTYPKNALAAVLRGASLWDGGGGERSNVVDLYQPTRPDVNPSISSGQASGLFLLSLLRRLIPVGDKPCWGFVLLAGGLSPRRSRNAILQNSNAPRRGRRLELNLVGIIICDRYHYCVGGKCSRTALYPGRRSF